MKIQQRCAACVLLASLVLTIGCPSQSNTGGDQNSTGDTGGSDTGGTSKNDDNTGGDTGGNTGGNMVTVNKPFAGGILGVKADATGKKDGSSWIDAFTDLQNALAAARVPGNSVQQIWVAKGTYKPVGPGGVKNISFQMINDIALYGGFSGTETTLDQRDFTANQTILTGDLNGNDAPNFAGRDDNAQRVVSFSQLIGTAILDGFTITGAFGTSGTGVSMFQSGGTIRNCTITDNRSSQGGGADVDDLPNSGIPVFISCTFKGNLVTDNGGSAVADVGGAVEFRDCKFSDNSGPKGAVWVVGIGKTGTTKLIGCTFTNNSCEAGGAVNNDVEGTQITECTFQGNQASGVFGSSNYGGGAIWADATFIATNCLFRQNNTVTEGGAIRDGSKGSTLLSCLFDRNQAAYGGGVFVLADASPTLINCTFAGNSGSSDGGGIFFTGKLWTLYNSIVWGNTSPGGTLESAQIFLGDTPSANQMTFCDVQNRNSLFTANNNISMDPLFVDAAGGNLRVKPASPVIDKGQNSNVPFQLTKDLDGNARILGTPPTVDMGAFEQ